jgi:hypothetical protein
MGKEKEGVRIWNPGGKNPLLLLLVISSHEEILYLAAGRPSSNCVFILHASGKRRVSGSPKSIAPKTTRHCTVQGVL